MVLSAGSPEKGMPGRAPKVVLCGPGDGAGVVAGVREKGVGAVRLGHGKPPGSGQ
jgi:hypothetical protein